ncbi:hypothetical protein LCGC14_1118150 [marine sediment metagenome]|uniref:Thymidylate synthase/dCMP hydroxymethylase domain-containing protein n=1 Tax=marine sediment metagenome TaxID=412755 RepID=A0A0F9MSN6_9ZZZZ
MSSLVKQVEDLAMRVGYTGLEVGGTKEIMNVMLTLHDTTYDKEREEVELYFEANGLDFKKKLEQEATHYQFLKYGLLQKIEYNEFYFKEPPINSRKLYIHSPDCISLIQILPRTPVMQVNAYLRSSEVKCLLPIDALGVLDICDALKWKIYVNEGMNPFTQVNIWIASAHIYTKGDPRREDILKRVH